MNELDDLKKLWQEENQPAMHLQRKKLEEVISKKSSSTLDWLKRIAKIEDWGNFIVTIGFTAICMYMKRWDWAIVFGIGMLAVSIYYHRLYKIIHRIEYSENVLDFLEDTYAALKSFLRKYLIGLIVITGISYVVSFSISFQENNEKVLDFKGWFILIIIAIIGFFISFAFVYLYYYLVYGRKAIKIKKMIKSLKDD